LNTVIYVNAKIADLKIALGELTTKRYGSPYSA